jgi:hypothetical protein
MVTKRTLKLKKLNIVGRITTLLLNLNMTLITMMTNSSLSGRLIVDEVQYYSRK